MSAALMKFFPGGIVAIALFALSPAAQAAWQQAEAAYTAGNYAAALQELKPLAEKGDARAQHMLAIMYENGQGVPQDYGQAMSWFGKAADGGNEQAMFHLGEMYRSGLGAAGDLVLAHKWYSLAAAAGNEYARHTMEAVEAKMAPEQIGRARALAKEWQAKHAKKK